jgi:hypothetical protein
MPTYEDSLLRFARTNLSWVKVIEKSLQDFIQDPIKKLHHFPQSKMAPTTFLLQLAAHYGLSAEVVDADRGKGSVIVRKSPGKIMRIPAVLVSVACVTSKPPAGPSVMSSLGSLVSSLGGGSATVGSTVLRKTGKQISQPVNAYQITGLIEGIEKEDLKVILEVSFPSVKWHLCVYVRSFWLIYLFVANSWPSLFHIGS